MGYFFYFQQNICKEIIDKARVIDYSTNKEIHQIIIFQALLHQNFIVYKVKMTDLNTEN